MPLTLRNVAPQRWSLRRTKRFCIWSGRCMVKHASLTSKLFSLQHPANRSLTSPSPGGAKVESLAFRQALNIAAAIWSVLICSQKTELSLLSCERRLAKPPCLCRGRRSRGQWRFTFMGIPLRRKSRSGCRRRGSAWGWRTAVYISAIRLCWSFSFQSHRAPWRAGRCEFVCAEQIQSDAGLW